MKNIDEELVTPDCEWGRPELTKKMLGVTPGQRIEEVRYDETGMNFSLKAEFLRRLRCESAENHGIMLSESLQVDEGLRDVLRGALRIHKLADTQKGHYTMMKEKEKKDGRKAALKAMKTAPKRTR